MAEANAEEQPLIEKQLTPENFTRYINSIMEQMQYRSKHASRSSNQATIFLYGKSGDGKSSTLNCLFDTKVIPTHSAKSETKTVTEYGCSLSSPLVQTGLSVSFIDTPGYGDVDGEDDDGENVAKISHFINEHPELGNSKKKVQVYPNIVLVVVSASDHRLCGIYAAFSKMLHVLSKLNVVDRLHPNVVIAVTHAMHFTRNGYSEKSKYIENICKCSTRAHLSIEVPVVFIENLDERNEMDKEGDWRILPDGTRQPLNLFHAMTRLMKQSGDEVGIEAVRLLFSQCKKCNIEKIKSIPENINLETSSKWNEIINEKFFSKKDNQIYSILLSNVNSDGSHIFPLVYHLKKINVVKPEDFLNRDLLEVKQALHPFQLTNEETEWLINLFNVRRINTKLDFNWLGIGHSREFKDKRKQILNIGLLKNKTIGNYVIRVPDLCSVKELRQVAIDIVYDECAKWLMMKYLKITFRICFILFQVKIDTTKFIKIGLYSSFVTQLERLLPPGVGSLEYILESHRFVDFVKDYALHCTTGLYFGGFIKGELYFDYLKDEEANKGFLDENTKILREQLERYFNCIQDGINPKENIFQKDEEFFRKLVGCNLTCAGGSKEYHAKTILDINVNKWKNWTNSIEKNITCIDGMVNSVFIGDILSASTSQKIRSYADVLKPIKTERQDDLEDINFQKSPRISTPLGINALYPGDKEEDIVITRVQATELAKPKKCAIL